MAAGVEAVIAALQVALEEAQKSDEPYWSAEAANRWIGRLPGYWTGRWRRLKLKAPSGDIERVKFIGHVRAVIAYLEIRLSQPASRTWWRAPRRGSGPASKLSQQPAAPVQAARPINLLRVRKPLPGVH